MAADRGAFIDQSQSLNIFMENANFAKLTSMHFYGWEKGLKTGMYYLRTKAARDAIKFTVDKSQLEEPVPIAKSKTKSESKPEEKAETTMSGDEYTKWLQEQRAIADESGDCEMCSG